MKTQVSNLERSAKFELRRISSIRYHLSTDATKTLVSALFLSRLDYFNSLLSGCPQYPLNKLQTVHNNAAHLFMRVSKRTTFLLILLFFIGCPLVHGYSTNSLFSVIIASSRLLLTTWLNSLESISQPANFAHLLILPFSVFPLYAHTRLIKGHFLLLHRISETLSLAKSGRSTPSHPSNHHLKPIFFSGPTDCVCVCVCVCVCMCGGRERERENW